MLVGRFEEPGAQRLVRCKARVDDKARELVKLCAADFVCFVCFVVNKLDARALTYPT